ncbi:hypothetical protein Micbo1qcDRAFT_178945 [Microdochium bolleyi]|uniref:Uncharacterized protein n=1 Tax=Microdochium bolleyi TaxID=196109 RepID=A0A136IRK0_9PEZI|nr:hypothetical protein Micbo1qcDRAFT_178945 [Microdochium bolleyi]
MGQMTWLTLAILSRLSSIPLSEEELKQLFHSLTGTQPPNGPGRTGRGARDRTCGDTVAMGRLAPTHIEMMRVVDWIGERLKGHELDTGPVTEVRRHHAIIPEQVTRKHIEAYADSRTALVGQPMTVNDWPVHFSPFIVRTLKADPHTDCFLQQVADLALTTTNPCLRQPSRPDPTV